MVSLQDPPRTCPRSCSFLSHFNSSIHLSFPLSFSSVWPPSVSASVSTHPSRGFSAQLCSRQTIWFTLLMTDPTWPGCRLAATAHSVSVRLRVRTGAWWRMMWCCVQLKPPKQVYRIQRALAYCCGSLNPRSQPSVDTVELNKDDYMSDQCWTQRMMFE